MSFMSFDYAMRAADAALQFHQQQGQNIKDTNARTREVGTGNAKRKDDLVRQKIEAEYNSESAEIKKDKALRMAQLAEEKKKNAMLAQAIVAVGTIGGGMLNGLMDLAKGDPNKVPDGEQLTIGKSQSDYASSFKIATGNGNSEKGAIAAFDPSGGRFTLVGMDTTSGQATGFVQLSASDMANQILKTTGNDTDNAALRDMIEAGPPPMFKAEHFIKQEDGSVELSPELKGALFGSGDKPGFFSSTGANEAGERMTAGLLSRENPISTAYGKTANSVMDLLGDTRIQQGLGMNPATVRKTEKAFEAGGHTIGGFSQAAKSTGNVFNKMLFKPLSTALPQFMELAKVAKQYAEEHQQKLAEYDAAKKQAALARKKLQKLETLLAMGSSG